MAELGIRTGVSERSEATPEQDQFRTPPPSTTYVRHGITSSPRYGGSKPTSAYLHKQPLTVNSAASPR